MAFFNLTSSAAAEAVLCSMLMVWWAFGFYSASQAPATELKPDPFDNEVSTPHPGAQTCVEARPTDLDLGIDFEAFRAQIARRCDLELDTLCDSTMDGQSARVLQDLEDEWRQCDLELDALCDSTMEDQSAKALQSLEDEWHQCDLELDALCESAMGGQSAMALQDLEDEFGVGPVVGMESGLDVQPNVELHGGNAREGALGHAKDTTDWSLDDLCAAVLKALEHEYRSSG